MRPCKLLCGLLIYRKKCPAGMLPSETLLFKALGQGVLLFAAVEGGHFIHTHFLMIRESMGIQI